jgi:hypothetical protein
MPLTTIRGKQVLDGTIQRHDLDVSTVGQAVVAKLIQGTNVTLSSTGGDAGTGDVTISVPSGGTGPPGPAGPAGATGPQGANANTTTTAPFTVPPVGQTISVTVTDASWIVVGQMLYVDTAGGGTGQAGALQVTAKAGNTLTLLNPQPAPAIPLASSSGAGLLGTLSGASTDYVGGDNACHPLAAGISNGYAYGGVIKYVSATQLSFAPFQGVLIRINGVDYILPSGGIAGLSTTSVYVNGVAGQNLAASTLYRVYCFNNAGTLTADFSTTAHATSATPGNLGVEIKSGDDTRTFIGLIYTNASSQFADTPTTRYVRSWVNRRSITFSANASLGSTAAAASTWYPLGGWWMLSFGDEQVNWTISGATQHSVVGATNIIGTILDGSTLGGSNMYTPTAGAWFGGGGSWAKDLTEGFHTFQGAYYTYNAGNVLVTFTVSGRIG